MKILKNLLVITAALALFLVYSYAVLKPQEFKNFSLIDDGQSIQYAGYFKDCFTGFDCGHLKSEIIERQFGRFRPLYWTIQSAFLNTFGVNPILQHEVRVYLVGGVMLALLIFLMIQSGSNYLATFFGAAIFVSSFSFSENIIRLGPIEPFQVILLGIFSFYYLSLNRISKAIGETLYFTIFTVLFLSLILIKETSAAIIPVVLVHAWFSNTPKKLFRNFVAIISFGLIILIGSILVAGKGTEVAYSSNYSLNPTSVIGNSVGYFQQFYNMTGFIFKFFVFEVIIMLSLGKFKSYALSPNKTYWILVFIFFTGILTPWPFVLERYLLVTMF